MNVTHHSLQPFLTFRHESSTKTPELPLSPQNLSQCNHTQSTTEAAGPKPNGPWTEEVTFFTVLSDQKCLRNSSESGSRGLCGGWWRPLSGPLEKSWAKTLSSARHDTSG